MLVTLEKLKFAKQYYHLFHSVSRTLQDIQKQAEISTETLLVLLEIFTKIYLHL